MSMRVGPSLLRARVIAAAVASMDSLGVASVDGRSGEAVAGGSGFHRRDRHLLIERDADRPAVVLAEEDDRELVHAREVHRLVHTALGRGAVTEPADGNGVFVLDAGCVRRADGVGHVRADLARDAADAQRRVGEVRRQLAAAAVRVVGTGERAEEQLVRRDPEREAHAEVAVVEPRGRLAPLAAPRRSRSARSRGREPSARSRLGPGGSGSTAARRPRA